jgi:hypothetical protein
MGNQLVYSFKFLFFLCFDPEQLGLKFTYVRNIYGVVVGSGVGNGVGDGAGIVIVEFDDELEVPDISAEGAPKVGRGSK